MYTGGVFIYDDFEAVNPQHSTPSLTSEELHVAHDLTIVTYKVISAFLEVYHDDADPGISRDRLNHLQKNKIQISPIFQTCKFG